MKNLYLLTIMLCLLLAACVQPGKYIGAKYPKTKTVDVYHYATEVKRYYKVIGRLVNRKYLDKEIEHVMVMDAKRIGGDAVILLGVDSTVTGKPNRVAADVLKYGE
ncbi:hypothetical protein [Mucilaginibacter ginsenosidivorans]|uniref:DUF4136 domain-containing protein n=1 Tax=Mucilaginibacter ginsenosidivorans TaxID=398053 RepID=A0A5B8UVK4_9SPHI|nr:hypothetical protein [Mucilaginibacter ginsenosidivorans]QEC62939.1 hypothetical protein FRZ54_10235 [Mucilaginibacter ginsenosidivorans]